MTNPIEQILESLDYPSGQDLVSSLETYAEELIKWNRRINLTGASAVDEFIRGPLFDAMTILKVLEKGRSLVDVGSGGGLPGIPVALVAPELKVTLVEPRSKRASFLRHVSHRLGLSVEILELREDKLKEEAWTSAVAQAVWPPGVWMDRSRRLVEPGGIIYVLSSDPIDPQDLPGDVALEREELCIRPFDEKKRYASSIRK